MEEEETQFHDYTIASPFERFVASLETCLMTWKLAEVDRQRARRQRAVDGFEEPPLKVQAQLDHRLPFRAEPYTLTLHLAPELAAPDAAGAVPSSGGAVQLPLASCLELCDAPHRLQQWFGAPAVLLLTPDSYSGRVLDEQEAHTLLSAAAVALSHACIPWPLLLPVHDAVRDGYRGVAAAPPALGCASMQLESDSLHSSRLPPRALRLDQQLQLLARRLAGGAAAAAAAACHAALAAVDLDAPPAGMAADAAAAGAGRAGGGDGLRVAVAARHSYAVPGWDESDAGGSGGWGEAPLPRGPTGEWDEGAPWRPWAAQADPVGCLELDLVWRFPTAAAALRAQAGAAGVHPGAEAAAWAPGQAARWRLVALDSSYERDTGHRGFVLRPVEKPRRFLQLRSLAGQQAAAIQSGAEVPPAALPGDSSFHGMLLRLLESCKWAARAPALGCLASADWWPQQGAFLPPAPPGWVLKEAVRDIFELPMLPVWPGSTVAAAVAWPTTRAGERGCLGKAAPLGALISRFALHALALGSPRAVAELWSRFVGTLRQAFWEQQRRLPRMPTRQQADGGAPDSGGQPEGPCLQHSLLHQKLQLLDLCIFWQQARQAQQADQPGDQPQQQQREQWAALEQAGWESGGSADGDAHLQPGSPASTASTGSSYFSAAPGSDVHSSPDGSQPAARRALSPLAAGDGDALSGQLGHSAANGAAAAAAETSQPGGAAPGDPAAVGVVGVLPGAALHLHPDRPLRIPAVHEPPPQTEDLIAEHQAGVQEAAGSWGAQEAAPAQLGVQLQGRMLLSDMSAFKAANPGGCLLDFVRWHSPKDCHQAAHGGWELSKRMAAENNTWQQLWAAAQPAPAAAQRPLFDPVLEGERALHFLETLPPPALFAELLAVGFSAAVQLLGVAGSAAELAPVRRQLDCLAAAAGPALARGVAPASLGCEAADGGQRQPGQRAAAAHASGVNGAGLPLQRLPSWLPAVHSGGLSGASYRRLLLLLGCAEQAVVAAHSLLLRLGPARLQQRPAAQEPGAEDEASLAAVAADGLLAAAMGEQRPERHEGGGVEQRRQQECGVAAAAVDLVGPLRQQLEALLTQPLEWEESESQSDRGSTEQGQWPEPFLREWLLEVHGGAALAAEAGPAAGGAVLHRMYVRALPSEVRIATAVSSELPA